MQKRILAKPARHPTQPGARLILSIPRSAVSVLGPGRKSRFRARFGPDSDRESLKARRRAHFDGFPIRIRPEGPISGPDSAPACLRPSFGQVRAPSGSRILHCSVNSFRFLGFLLWFVSGPGGLRELIQKPLRSGQGPSVSVGFCCVWSCSVGFRPSFLLP